MSLVLLGYSLLGVVAKQLGMSGNTAENGLPQAITKCTP